MKDWKLMVGGLAIAAVATVLPAQVFAHDHFERMHEYLEKMEEKLDLRKEQKDALKAQREATKAKREALRNQSRDLHKQIKDAIKAGANQGTLDNLGTQWGKLQVARMQMLHEHSKAFEKVLDAEQKAKFEAMKAEKKKRWEEKHGSKDDE